jgi:membrane associated rhomboid family serine protease
MHRRNCVFGLFGAWLAAGLRNRNTLQGRLLLRQIGPLVLLNVGISFLPGIAWQAHFGGLAAGLLIAGVWGRVTGRGQAPRAALGVTVALIAVVAVVIATLL